MYSTWPPLERGELAEDPLSSNGRTRDERCFSACLTRIKSNWGTQTVSTTKLVGLRRYRKILPNAVPRSDSSSSQLGVTTRCALLQPTREEEVRFLGNLTEDEFREQLTTRSEVTTKCRVTS